MVRRISANALELDTKLTEAALGVQQGLYKSSYAAAKALGLNKVFVLKRVNGGLSRGLSRGLVAFSSPPTTAETFVRTRERTS
jgi:hypothetical protein